ncbi:permease [Verrucomicrobia bacterium S94]|nr:permease [Verrucomicrobia bacterium S94]
MNRVQEIAIEAGRDGAGGVNGWLSEIISRGLSELDTGLSPDLTAGISKALATFIFIFAELTLLFLSISFIIGILQSYIPAGKIQRMLNKKRGYMMAALLGAVTPFCSCSTIPFLKGLIRAGAGFGGIIVFLLASPLLNPIIIGLFFISFGLKVAIYYFAVAMGFSILAGILLEQLGFQKYIRPISSTADEPCGCAEPASESSPCCDTPTANTQPATWSTHCRKAWKQAVSDFKGAFWFMLGGVLIGCIIYGFVPESFISRYAGGSSPLAVPVAAVVGVPLYIRAEAVIPISLGLVDKGMSLGAVIAFIIGSAGASLTEVVLLKSLFRNPIIAAFLIVVFTMAILAGYLLPFFL